MHHKALKAYKKQGERKRHQQQFYAISKNLCHIRYGGRHKFAYWIVNEFRSRKIHRTNQFSPPTKQTMYETGENWNCVQFFKLFHWRIVWAPVIFARCRPSGHIWINQRKMPVLPLCVCVCLNIHNKFVHRHNRFYTLHIHCCVIKLFCCSRQSTSMIWR